MNGLAEALVGLSWPMSAVLTVRTLAHDAHTFERQTLSKELEDLEGVIAYELLALDPPACALDVLRAAEVLLDEVLDDDVAPQAWIAATLPEAFTGLFDGICHLRTAHGYGIARDATVRRRAAKALAAGFGDLERAWPAEELDAVAALADALAARMQARLERLM